MILDRPGVAYAARDGKNAMRLITAAVGFALGLAPAAVAAADLDLGPLRGSYGNGLDQVVRWQGGYFAGTAGASTLDADANGAFGELVAQAMRLTQIETEMRVSTWLDPSVSGVNDVTYGVLAGYNWQFSEAVLGVEGDITFGRLSSSATESLSRFQTTTNGFTNFVTATGTVAVELKNWATLRARAGYTLGAFLPFVTGGLAVAEYETTRTARVNGNQVRYAPDGVTVQQNIPFDTGQLGGSGSGYALGLASGAGIDVALTQNVFLRGEWQYLFFPDVSGTEVSVSTVRGAAGVKF